MTLILRALPEESLERLRSAMEELETSASPLALNDFEDEFPEVVTNLVPSFLPAITAADALAENEWSSFDRDLVVTIASSCPKDHGTRCLRIWDRARPGAITNEERRARVLAWPVGCAALLRARPLASKNDVMRALRDRAGTADSEIALVIDERTLSGVDPDSKLVEEIRSLAARSVRLIRKVGEGGAQFLEPMLDAIARPPPVGRRLVPWRLDEDRILVVPRLRTLADLDRFSRDIATTLDLRALSSSTEWIHRPPPLAHVHPSALGVASPSSVLPSASTYR
jgi:hypothetical protein